MKPDLAYRKAISDVLRLFDKMIEDNDGEGIIYGRFRDHLQVLRDGSPPYPWCRQPEVCIHKGYCPKDPNCGE